MSIAFTYYAKIRNNYCISYYGLIPEYVVMLRLLRPHMSKDYPHLRIFISCRDEIIYLLDGETDVVRYSEIYDRKNEFGYIREMHTSLGSPHAIEVLIKDSLPNFIAPPQNKPAARRCLVCPDGALPTRSHPDASKLRDYAESRGYTVTVAGSDIHPGPARVDLRPGSDKFKLLDVADWVIGVENEYLFEAVRRGLKTTLVPTGVGSNLYKLLSPCGEIAAL